MSIAHPNWRLASLVGLVFALGIPIATTSVSGGDVPASVDGVAAILLNEAFMWVLTLAVLAIVLFWERRPLASIGLVRPSWNAVQVGAGVAMALLVLAAVAGAIAQALSGLPEPGASEMLVMGLPLWVQLFAAISAGFTEEILFRGYAIERMTELTGRRWLGALFPVVVFGAIHAPFWGVAHAIVAGLTGLWLTGAYLWRRNLWTNITAHALLDVLAFVAGDQVALHGAANV